MHLDIYAAYSNRKIRMIDSLKQAGMSLCLIDQPWYKQATERKTKTKKPKKKQTKNDGVQLFPLQKWCKNIVVYSHTLTVSKKIV